MKPVYAFFIVGIVFSASLEAAKTVEPTKMAEQKINESEAKSEKSATETKWICAIGLEPDYEPEGVFIETYKNRKECKRYCKGPAPVCQETEAETPVNPNTVG